MANLHENTTIGGSIAITAKNIKDYIDNIGAGGNGTGGLEIKDVSFEDYIKEHSITDLNQLLPTTDVGIYITKGGITSPDANIYGTVSIDASLTTTHWNTKVFKPDVSYILNKSPLTDKVILIVLNNDANPNNKNLVLWCYHAPSKVWYRMDANSNGTMTKMWVVDEQIVRSYKNFSLVADTIKTEDDKRLLKTNNLSDLTNISTARSNLNITLVDTVGSGNNQLFASQKLAHAIDGKVNSNKLLIDNLRSDLTTTSSNTSALAVRMNTAETKITGLENSKITGGSVVQSVGTSTVNVPSVNLLRNELAKKQDNLEFVGGGSYVRESAVKSTYMNDSGNYYNSSNPLPDLLPGRSGTAIAKWFDVLAPELGIASKFGSEDAFVYFEIQQMFNKSPSGDRLLTITSLRGGREYQATYQSTIGKWDVTKVYNSKTTTLDKNGVLHVGTTTPIDTLIVSDLTDAIQSGLKSPITSAGVHTGLNTKLTAGSLVQAEGSSTTDVMSQKAVTDGLNKRITGGSIVQSTGSSTLNVPSQKLMTDQLNLKLTAGSLVQTTGTSTTNVMSQKAVTDTLNKKFNDHGALGTVDLNTLNTSSKCGIYYQSANSNATRARNYPMQFAGTLEVMESAGFTQRYTLYNSTRTFIRNNYGGTWSKWNEIPLMSDVDAKANSSLSLTAGNGLSGGGNLTANRTFTLGTPSSITSSSTNSVTSTSHTHAIDKASLTQAGMVQLTSTIDDSEDKAVTPKAVNTVKKKADQVPTPIVDRFLVGNNATTYKLLTVDQVKTLLTITDEVPVPVDQIFYFDSATPPAGYIARNGQAIDKVKMPKLFARYGANMPDDRDRVHRMTGPLAGAVGTTQEDAIRNIVGEVQGGVGAYSSGVFSFVRNNGDQAGQGWPQRVFKFDASTVVPTADENRVKSRIIIACNKIQ